MRVAQILLLLIVIELGAIAYRLWSPQADLLRTKFVSTDTALAEETKASMEATPTPQVPPPLKKPPAVKPLGRLPVPNTNTAVQAKLVSPSTHVTSSTESARPTLRPSPDRVLQNGADQAIRSEDLPAGNWIVLESYPNPKGGVFVRVRELRGRKTHILAAPNDFNPYHKVRKDDIIWKQYDGKPPILMIQWGEKK